MEKLEKDDMQGLIVRGYGKLPFARYVLLQGNHKESAKKYLATIHKKVNTAFISPDDFALNVAFTSDGLKFLGLPETSLSTFSREFKEGMSDSDRAKLLGDQNESDPAKWKWGGRENKKVHVLLLLYARDNETLEKEYQQLIGDADYSKGYIQLEVKETSQPFKGKEHFGFKDGISRPTVDSFKKSDKSLTPIKKNEVGSISTGEFVLGYENEYDRHTEIPTVSAEDDPDNILPGGAKTKLTKDFGRNGTYLVYREIEQEVFKFWEYLAANSQEPGENRTEKAIKLGTKMVGRWPSGCPLMVSSEVDDPSKGNERKFNYYEDDRKGLICPIGSHTRRTNPRDHLIDRNQKNAIEMVRKHHLIRRGKNFGPPLVESMEPEDVLKLEKDDGQKRGIHFICLNADISRQFEFVQSIWVQSSKFGGLYNDSDPIIGSRITNPDRNNDEFTAKSTSNPIRNRYKHLPQFTKVVGGAYFFLPGIKALKFLSHD